jgi:hypothetical protein
MKARSNLLYKLLPFVIMLKHLKGTPKGHKEKGLDFNGVAVHTLQLRLTIRMNVKAQLKSKWHFKQSSLDLTIASNFQVGMHMSTRRAT